MYYMCTLYVLYSLYLCLKLKLNSKAFLIIGSCTGNNMLKKEKKNELYSWAEHVEGQNS